jgi:hypothetical protein
MTIEQKRDLTRCAEQAAAHGKLATAEWYRAWANAGRPIGDKPDERGRQYAGTAE